jgi:hypothetical protein
MAESWRLKGDFIDFCKCAVPCPCTFGRPPTEGDCDGIIGFRFREGNYGDVDMGGVNVIALARFEGNIWDPDVRADMGMIIDESTSEEQRESLQALFGGQAGGWLQLFAENMVGAMLGMEVAPIELEIDDDLESWRVRIDGKVEGGAELLTGPTSGGERLAVHNPPGSEVGPGQGPATYGIATTDTVDAFGLNWEWSGRSAKHIPFEWSSEDKL